MEWWQIYLITRVSEAKEFFILISSVLLAVMLVGTIITVVHCNIEDEDWFELARKIRLKLWCIVVAVIGFISMLLPTDKDIAIILAGHWATHNEQMTKLPDNVLKTLNGLLEKAQEKLK